MLMLLKLLSNQHLISKLNLDNSLINLLYRILIHLLKDTPLKNILSNDYQRNKLIITNYHSLLIVYITSGYLFCRNYENKKEKELKNILKELIFQSQKKEKNHFEKCNVCNEINKIIQTNNIMISINESTSNYKNAIRINNNCLSAQKLMEECHLITKVKGQNEGISLQHYISNANKQQKNNSNISINKTNNFNDTYDNLKTSFSSISESLINQKILKTTNNENRYKFPIKKRKDTINKSILNQSILNSIEIINNSNVNILDLRKVNSRNGKNNHSPPRPRINIQNNINNIINDIQNGIHKLKNEFDNFKTFTENTKKQMKLYTYLEFPKKNKK